MKLPPFITTFERDYDSYGSGKYGASRDGGRRMHNGIDIGFAVCAIIGGKVTKIGFPYNPSNELKAHFRYVEVQDEAGLYVRYFYVDPMVGVGDEIKRGDYLGFPQDLTEIYPGITPHIHFEVMDENRNIVDPEKYLEEI